MYINTSNAFSDRSERIYRYNLHVHSIPPIQYELCMTPACYQFVCANYIEQRWDVSAFTVLFSASLFLSFSLFLFLLPFNYFYFYLFVSLSFSVCLSSTICLSVCLFWRREREKFSLFSLLSFYLSLLREKEESVMERRGIVNNHRLQNHVYPASWSPFLSPRFEKFRLLKHTPVRRCVVTERCVPFYLRNSTVLLLSEVHVVKENFISSPF